MADEITPEELEAALAAAVDAHGNDIRVAEWVASMTDEERRTSEANLRRSLAEARASLKRRRGSRNA